MKEIAHDTHLVLLTFPVGFGVHIFRIRGIVKRLMKSQYPEFLRGNVLPLVVSLARSHAYWPGQEGYQELERC